MLRMMVRPQWVLALLLALAIAAGFALLGQWQLGRAIESGTTPPSATETRVALTEVARPGEPIREADIGHKVTATGRWVPGDEQIIGGRLNGGQAGWWVVSRFEVDVDGAPAIPVARGWAADEDTARAVAADLARESDETVSIAGRMLPTEAPEVPDEDGDPHAMTTIAVSALINLWTDFAGRDVYSAYIVSADAASGLELIDSPAPEQERALNWLNVFYAVEWVVFAGFAVFLWFRLVKDAWLREQEEAALLEEARADAAGTPDADKAPLDAP